MTALPHLTCSRRLTLDEDGPQVRYTVISIFDGSFCVSVTVATGERYASPTLRTQDDARRWIKRDKARRAEQRPPDKT